MDKTAEEPLFKTGTGQEDSFYDTIETSSPDYEGARSPQGAIDPEEEQRQREECERELKRLEEEINTLRTVLGAKITQANELKHKLGITQISEFKSELKQSVQSIKQSDAFRKTNDQLSKLNAKITSSPAYQKTGTAFKSFGAWSSQKLGAVRNSNAFKSFEEKVGGAYTNVKGKMSGSKSENNFHEALDSPTEPTIAENPSAGAVLPTDQNN